MSETTVEREKATQRELSVIIPAYNEAKRLPSYLHSVRSYLDKTLPLHYEVIVVDDGSDDNTGQLVHVCASGWPELRCITHARNTGKGSAMRTGALDVLGEVVLFTDADGATPIEYEWGLREAVYAGADVAMGVRKGCELGNTRHPVRKLLSGVFRATSRLLLGTGHRDSQCGFKLMRRDTARVLFSSTREQGYLIDLEVLTVAARMGLKLVEVPVAYRDVPGSKVKLVGDSWRMFVGLSRLAQNVRRRVEEIKQSDTTAS
jgi:dolichyl-phosphate beta-glucosyltransferase